MTTREKTPTILTEAGARRLTDRLVTTLTEAHELLIDLWVGRAWEALHYPNWAAFCEAELGDLLFVKLPPAMRREAAAHMKEAGMSYRNIAAPFGVSPASIHADLAPPKPKPSVQKLNAGPSGYRRAAELVAAAGAVGLTYIELCDRSGWRGGQATGALSEAKRRGLIVPTGMFRDACSVYVVPR